MRLARPSRARAAISLVAMIDVLMILLFFFMITSTYLDLDMVPLVASNDDAPSPAASREGGPLLLRLGSDGQAYVQGRLQPADQLTELIATHVAQNSALEILILPSGEANAQALAWLMDVAAAAGAKGLRVLRIEALP